MRRCCDRRRNHWIAPCAADELGVADFRRDNDIAIVETCRAFVLFCRDQDLFTARLVALDGSKFRAATALQEVHLALMPEPTPDVHLKRGGG